MLCQELRELLLAAYRPCPEFDKTCTRMRWAPDIGHLPRGFCGASGTVQDVNWFSFAPNPEIHIRQSLTCPAALLRVN